MPEPRYVTEADLEALAAVRRASGELDLRDGELWARTPFAYKDHLKAIGGARWDPNRKSWHYQQSPVAAMALDRAIPKHIAYRTPAFEAYVANARAADEARSAVLNADEGDLAPIPVTRKAAWGHQRRAYWSARDRSAYLLAMGMGTGKTKVAIDLIQNSDDQMILIICPKSVVGVWPREITKHAADPDSWRVAALRSGATATNLKQAIQAKALAIVERRRLAVIINYDSVWRTDFGAWVLAQKWDTVIADESHRIKDPSGRASKFLSQLTTRAKRRLALTGTPMAHTPLDVFSQYRFLDPSIFGPSYFTFKHRYGAWGGYGGYQLVGLLNEAELNQKFFSIAYRVGNEVLDLPPVLPNITREVMLSPEAKKHYSEMANEFVTWVSDSDEGAVTASNALTKLLRLQQITSGYLPDPEDPDKVVHLDSSKRDALKDVLEDIDKSEPVVVFCRFRHDLDVVAEVVKELGRRYGELSGRSRDGLTADGEMNPNVDVIGIQIQSGGVGIDLTRARYCIYYSLGYSLTDFEQSKARVHRPGQTRPTQYIYLVVPASVDVAVFQALDSRRNAIEEILSLARAGSIDSEEIQSFDDEWTLGDDPADRQANRRAVAEGNGWTMS